MGKGDQKHSRVASKNRRRILQIMSAIAATGGVISMLHLKSIRYYQSKSEASAACYEWMKKGREVELTNPYDTGNHIQDRQVRAWNRECAYDEIKNAFIGLAIKDSMTGKNYASAIQGRETRELFEKRNPKDTWVRK